jgi:hypothetical protein
MVIGHLIFWILAAAVVAPLLVLMLSSRRRNATGYPVLMLCVALLSGCTGIGPKSINRDRFDYSSAVADSWKEQALLNIVKLRYGDNPVFVDVAQIVSGYTLQSTVSGFFGHNATTGHFDGSSIGAQGSFTDRPTITYTPLTGQQYMRGILSPIAPSSVLFLLQAGYAADFVLLMTVESINGLNNRSDAPARMTPGDPAFFRVVELIRKAQRSGNIGMRIEVGNTKKETTLLTFHRRPINAEFEADRAEIGRLLRLERTIGDYKVSYGMTAGGGSDIDLETRSVYQIMQELAGTVDVPQAHLDEGSAYPVPPQAEGAQPLMHVHSGTARPEDSFAAVQYRGYWFWINQNDLVSKRSFAFLIGIFNFADTGKPENLPLITIPAQ